MFDCATIYYSYAYNLAQAINKRFGISETSAIHVINTRTADEIEIIIEYVGLTQAPGTFTIDKSLLQGGTAGISATVTTLRPYS